MTSASWKNRNHTETAALYALRALPASETVDFESHLGTCEDCRRELATLRPVVDSFVSWPADVLRPSASLWDRISTSIANETGGEPLPEPPTMLSKPEWEAVAPGISVKILSVDAEGDHVTMLVHLEPHTDYPPHRHAGIEELHLLDGILMVDDRTLHPGDFIHAEAGSMDHRVWSQTGCTCVLFTSTKDALF